MKSGQPNTSTPLPTTTKSTKKISFPVRNPSPKRIVLGFADNKPIQIELDSISGSNQSQKDQQTDSGVSDDKPFIVMATSVSSSVSSSVGGFSRRSDLRNKMARKGKLNETRNDRINVFKRFFPKRHYLHRF